MIKRIASLLFVFPAIMIILAHAFIPHHHHHDRVCFNLQSCLVSQDSSHEHSFHELSIGNISHECHFQDANYHGCTLDKKATAQENTSDNKHPIPCYHCHHDGYPDESESAGCCILAEIIIFHPGPQRHELTCPTFEIKDHSGFQWVIPGFVMHAGQIFIPGNLPFRIKPFITPNFLNIAVTTPGLRAPPSC